MVNTVNLGEVSQRKTTKTAWYKKLVPSRRLIVEVILVAIVVFLGYAVSLWVNTHVISRWNVISLDEKHYSEVDETYKAISDNQDGRFKSQIEALKEERQSH